MRAYFWGIRSSGITRTGKRKSKFEPQMGGFIKCFNPLDYRDRFASWDQANRFAAQMVEQVIIAEDPDTIAGVMIEPISNTGGIATPAPRFHRLLREICDRHHVLLIYDEIITGFGRTGNMFAAQTYGVTPDILCAGKALGTGVIPMGAMIAREDMAEAFYGPAEAEIQFAHGHTFAGNPLACAVGIAVIDEIVENNLCAKAQQLGDHIAERFENLKRLGVVREVRGKGVLRGVELVEDPATGRPYPADRKLGDALKETALANQLIMRIDPDWFAVCPALISEEKDIDEMCDLVERSLQAALDQIARPMK